MNTPPIIRSEFADGVATVTLNRPEARNALNSALLAALPEALSAADQDERVKAVVLTGADPAFCAGLDLKELGSTGGNLGSGQAEPDVERLTSAPFPVMTKPVIGAINGPAVTGGLEIALRCDFLVASEQARFADTHARVGIQPGWGLTVLLPQAVGLRRAREMSATGNFVDAATALSWGLVNHVVPHGELLGFAQRLAADIASNDARAVQTIYATYDEGSLLAGGEAWDVESRTAAAWQGAGLDPAEIERRRQTVSDRGRKQV